MQYSSSIVITELNADGSTYRGCTLRGPALPFMGASWSFENRLPTEWYPGNQQEATQHVMGRKEMPSTWNGEWNKTRMVRAPSTTVDEDGNAASVTDPTVLHDFLTEMFSSGRRLRVVWSTEQMPNSNSTSELSNVQAISYSITREGRCERFEPKFDIEWSAQFTWVSRGATTAFVTQPRDQSVANNSSQYNNALAAIIATNQYAAQAANPSHFTLGQLEQLASYPSEIVTDVTRSMLQLENGLGQIVNVAATIASEPDQIKRAAINSARNTMQLAQENYQQLSSIGIETMSTQDDVASILRAHAQFAQTQEACLEAAAAAFNFLFATRNAVPVHAPSLAGAINPQSAPDPSTILAVYQVVQGDTLNKVSQRFYGNPDHGDDIARANGLSDYSLLLPQGKIIIVPRISSSSSNATSQQTN